MKLLKTILTSTILLTTFITADNYEVSLTRKGNNFYQVNYKNIFVQTNYCYEYAYSEDSILKLNGAYSSEVIFLDNKSRCDIKAIYEEANQNAGKYSVTVSREEDDWYEIWGEDMFIKTSSCLNLALSDKAVLDISSSGYGTLYFDDDECMVEGIYAKQRL